MAEKNPDAFLPDVAMTLNNLVILKFGEPEEAEKYLLECLPIHRALAKASPSAQNLELARTLTVAGFIYTALNEADKNQTFFKEALSIAEKYAGIPFPQQLIGRAKDNLKK